MAGAPLPTPSTTSRSARERRRPLGVPAVVPVVAPVAAGPALGQRPQQASRAARPRRPARASPRSGRRCARPAAPGRRRERGGERGLPRAGRAVDADQPAGTERGAAGTRPGRATELDHGSEGEPVATVGRDLLDEPRRPTAGARCWRARRARRTWRAGTRPGRRSPAVAAGCPVSGVCTSPAPSSPVRCSPAGAHGVGSRSLPAGPDATSPPPCTVATWGDGRRVTGRPKNAAGRGCEGLVVVEQGRAPAAPSRPRPR